MSSLQPAIIFINGDITYDPTPPDVFIGSQPNNPSSYITSSSELNNLQTQLFIDDTMTKKEFDARIIADPNYPTVVHLQGIRILVILPTFHDLVNRHFADVVMFLHQGLADIETNKFRCPGQSYQIQRLNVYEILRAEHSHDVIELPFGIGGNCCNTCHSPLYCDECHTFSGIRICRECSCECKCWCNIHAPNKDNEAHNYDFIHRK